MSELERIKALAASAPAGPWQMDPESYTVCDSAEEAVAYDFRNEQTAEFTAEARTLVPQLVALIEKIRDDMTERATQYEATADRLWDLVRTRDPERDAEEAVRYSDYAVNARASAYIIDKTIKEGLTP